MKVVEYSDDQGLQRIIFCPACRTGHFFTDEWNYNGNHILPTFSPSLKVNRPGGGLCHFNVWDGWIYYDGDSTHSLAKQSVELPEFPEELR